MDSAHNLCGIQRMAQRIVIISWVATCVAIVTIVWCAAFGPTMNPFLAWLDAHDGAAWVQAVGSVAALFALFVAQRLDHARDAEVVAKTVEQDTADQAEALLLLATPIQVEVGGAQALSQAGDWSVASARIKKANFASLLKMIEAVQLHKLPGRRAAVAAMAARMACIQLIEHLSEIEEILPTQPDPNVLDDWVATLETHIDYLESIVVHAR
ncbi:hypothetical protein [Brevundimonas sp. DWR2-3-1b1]|uniref:hypothetical protein n=1 Tax=unclassified Brevundimonas TaxID=2622653 RepID=UPI003CE8FF45